MDQTEFYAVAEGLQKVSPALAKLTELEDSGAKWVYLIEACNHGAKLAREQFKALREAGHKEEAKERDAISSRLMKAAKNTMLSNAMDSGAEAFLAKDDKGENVILVRHADAGVIALHQVNIDKIDPAIAARLRPDEDGMFTGFRRQRLAELNAESLFSADHAVNRAIVAASLSKTFAGSVNEALGGVESAQKLPAEQVAQTLVSLGREKGLL